MDSDVLNEVTVDLKLHILNLQQSYNYDENKLVLRSTLSFLLDELLMVSFEMTKLTNVIYFISFSIVFHFIGTLLINLLHSRCIPIFIN